MSRIESVHDRSISHQLQHIPCGRCQAAIAYDRGAEWSVVSELVNEHWKTCPGRPHAKLAYMVRTPPSPPDTEIASPPPVVPELCVSSNTIVESVGSPNKLWISSGCERKRRTLEQRKLELEQDEYAKNVTTKSVLCGGCDREISLDKRSKYYPGLWLKHKGKCHGIEKLERAKTKASQVPNGTRQVSCDIVTSVAGSDSCGELQHLGPFCLAERCQDQSVAATHRSDRHCGSEDLPSEDEEDEEDEESLPQEPFPTLNCTFYWTQRHDNRTDEWAYRYATKDEITTNLFRGQNEPYARLGGHPLANPTPQTGSYSETSRCVIKDRVEPTTRQF